MTGIGTPNNQSKIPFPITTLLIMQCCDLKPWPIPFVPALMGNFSEERSKCSRVVVKTSMETHHVSGFVDPVHRPRADVRANG
jgi:hypothetical protein